LHPTVKEPKQIQKRKKKKGHLIVTILFVAEKDRRGAPENGGGRRLQIWVAMLKKCSGF
jgi:hypothetical protein